MQHILDIVDFLNQGLLPFIGRKALISEIIHFSNRIIEGTDMGVMLISGEAGVGKSRLIAELAQIIEESDGITLYTRFRSNSSVSLISLIAKEISNNELANSLLRKEISPNPSSVIESLERLNRLRLTVLFVEDIHLATGDCLEEIANILRSLESDPITIIFTARPIEFPARAVIEKNLLEQFVLKGLTQSEIDEMINSLFGRTDEQISNVLSEATFGNPLFIRSALRNSIRKGHLVQDINGNWKIKQGFSSAIHRSKDLLTEGMVSHLQPNELKAAQDIACLGEAFARETALELLNSDEQIFKTLISKGIISESLSVVHSINPDLQSSFTVFAFTHTLLHEHFLKDAIIEAERLLKLLADNLPMYSFLIYDIIKKSKFSLRLNEDDYLLVFHRLGKDAFKNFTSANWRFTTGILELYGFILNQLISKLNETKVNYLKALLAVYKTHEAMRLIHTPSYQHLVEEACELSKKVTEKVGVWFYFSSLINLCIVNIFKNNITAVEELFNEVKELLKEHLHLRNNLGPYDNLMYLLDFINMSGNINNLYGIVEDLDSYFTEAIKKDYVDQYFKDILEMSILISSNIYSKEQYNRVQNAKGIAVHLPDNMHNAPKKIIFFIKTANFHNIYYLSEMVQNLYTQAEMHGEGGFIYEAIADISLKENIKEDIFEKIMMVSKTKEGMYHEWYIKNDIINELLPILSLRLDTKIINTFLDVTGVKFADLKAEEKIILCLNSQDLKNVIDELYASQKENKLTNFSFSLLVENDIKTAKNIFDGFITTFFPLTYPISELSAYLQVIKHYSKTNPEVIPFFQPSIEESLEKCLEIFSENKLDFLLGKWLNVFNVFLNKDREKHWKKELAAIQKFHAEEAQLKLPKISKKIMVSLLGDVKYRMPNEHDFTRLQGARTKRLIGAMVIQDLSKNKLETDEFIRLVLNEDDITEKSHHALNVVVSRLREKLGKESIITSAETTPRFYQDLIMVDIVECRKNIKKIQRYLRDNNVAGAFRLCLQTLDIWSGSVPFPTLYDNVFEDIRDDLENGIREVANQTSSALFKCNDFTAAKRIAGVYLKHIPDDEDLKTYLASTTSHY